MLSRDSAAARPQWLVDFSKISAEFGDFNRSQRHMIESAFTEIFSELDPDLDRSHIYAEVKGIGHTKKLRNINTSSFRFTEAVAKNTMVVDRIRSKTISKNY